MPSNATPSNSHKYLIETNPALTELKQFLNSDYLLGGLGINPDDSKKRLGDGLYEQRLVREAIVQRTGQRFIAGLNSDEAMFRYLMDNAIASKDVLGLTPGVTLSAAQVAALTHDIVWLEEVEVNGEKVLAPVVYLAQAEGRLGPNGALIQGRDVNLITGGDLRNAGTLRAQNDLSATAGNIDNSGLIEAGNRLDLLASGSIRNDQGGIIAGREVSLSALTGDVINERTVTQHQSSYRGTGTTEAFADSAARIEAAQKLTVSAGRDVANIGGVIDSKGDLALQGGRDVLVSAAVAERGWTAGSQAYQTQTTQMGAEVVAGRDISVSAGRDISVAGSRIDARRDVTFEAGRDVGLVAAANEEHAYGKTKKVTFQDDKITQQATRVDAGGDLAINAGQDLRLVASQASAGDEAYLVAGDKLELLAANDSSYYLYDKKSKGSFGSKKTRRDEITDVTAVGSQISSGGDLTLLSGGDQTYQGAKLESGNDLAIVSGGAVTFDAVKDLHQESHEKSKGDLAWQSSKGKGQTDETVRQSQLVAQGNLAIKAVEGLKIDLKHIDQKTVSQTIDAMVQADPQLAWLKQMEQRGDVDWRRVQELHDSWKYSNSGLGVGAQLAIAIVVTYFTAGAASGAIATAGAGTSMAGATAAATATTSAGWLNAAGTAALSGVASNGAISTINNRGNLGDVVKDVTSSDALRGYVVAGTTAGLTAGVYDKWTSTQTGTSTALPNTGAVAPAAGLGTWQGVGQFTSNQLLQNGTSVLLDRALGGKGSLGDALQNSLANAFAAYGFKLIGDTTHGVLDDGSLGKIGLHALMGGLAAEAAGGDFRTGALAAGVNEALVDSLAKQYASLPIDDKKGLLTMSSQLIGMLAASTQGDADAKSLQTGAWVAGNATQNNYIEHSDVLAFAEDMRSCGKDEGCQKDKWEKERYSDESKLNVQEAQNTYGPLRAKEKRLQIVESMDTLVSIQCVTSRCESYKTELLEQSVDSYIHLSKVLDEWVPTLDRLALIGGAAAGKQIDSKVKRPGMPEPVELAQVQKAVDYLAALKATGASGKPLVSKGSEVTPEVIQKALQGDRVITAQGAVSLPAVQRYVDRLLKGDVAPAIKMDGNVIVDGNHRYIAAKILGRNLDVTPGSLSPNKVHQTKPVSELKIDQVDWGNK
ncbi:p120 [Pseudomonas aeruginosa]|nr:p120 [Pseudomonas aeruginosa]